MSDKSEQPDRWAVYRTDDTGNSFLVREQMTREDADRLAAEFTARGHKQFYWVEREASRSPEGATGSSQG